MGLAFLETLCCKTCASLCACWRRNRDSRWWLFSPLASALARRRRCSVLVDRILFRSLPYPQDDRLVSFGV